MMNICVLFALYPHFLIVNTVLTFPSPLTFMELEPHTFRGGVVMILGVVAQFIFKK